MNTSEPRRLPLALFFLRLSVFIVFFVWTVDKFVRPSHASTVYQKFYFLPAFAGPYRLQERAQRGSLRL